MKLANYDKFFVQPSHQILTFVEITGLSCIESHKGHLTQPCYVQVWQSAFPNYSANLARNFDKWNTMVYCLLKHAAQSGDHEIKGTGSSYIICCSQTNLKSFWNYLLLKATLPPFPPCHWGRVLSPAKFLVCLPTAVTNSIMWAYTQTICVFRSNAEASTRDTAPHAIFKV